MKKIVPKDNGVKFAIGCKKKKPALAKPYKACFPLEENPITVSVPSLPDTAQHVASGAQNCSISIALVKKGHRGGGGGRFYIIYPIHTYIHIIHVYVIITYISFDVFVCVQYNIGIGVTVYT